MMRWIPRWVWWTVFGLFGLPVLLLGAVSLWGMVWGEISIAMAGWSLPYGQLNALLRFLVNMVAPTVLTVWILIWALARMARGVRGIFGGGGGGGGGNRH
jgi:hypothetical protein